jgi:hypothetical protein
VSLTATTHIRPFTAGDIRGVADLYARAFRHSQQPASVSVHTYCRDVFLDHPWYDPEIASLVLEGADGRISGFLGVMARPMTFRHERVRAAIACLLMVDPDRRQGFAAFELARRFLAGPQDLSYTDGAAPMAQVIWERVGGRAVLLPSTTWLRLLRPGRWLAAKLVERRSTGGLARVIGAACRATDAVVSGIGLNPFRPAATPLSVEIASDEQLLAAIRTAAARYALSPDYDLDSLGWLLRKAGEASSQGELRRILVRHREGPVAAWCVYYVRPGGVANVLQLAGDDRSLVAAANAVFLDAWRRGAVGLSGQVQPWLLKPLSLQRCLMTCPHFGVLVHSRRPDIVGALSGSDAFVTRLEGEWWQRFGIDRQFNW